jgi:hypothetical protein
VDDHKRLRPGLRLRKDFLLGEFPNFHLSSR